MPLIAALVTILLVTDSSALRLSNDMNIVPPVKGKSLFCTAFVMNTGGLFDLVEKQLKKCDDYMFLSTYDDPARKIVKVMDQAPPKSQLNWALAEPMWEYILKRSDEFDWFLKVDSDCFIRPTKMKASLAKYSLDEPIAVGRPGRNGKIMLVGAAFALNGKMVKQLQTKKLDRVQLTKGAWHSEDTVMNAWIPHSGGIVKNPINDDNGCTSFSSTDRQELPTASDIEAMKTGKSYTKQQPKGKTNMKLGDICYSSDLAAIHPVKDHAVYESLVKHLDP